MAQIDLDRLCGTCLSLGTEIIDKTTRRQFCKIHPFRVSTAFARDAKPVEGAESQHCGPEGKYWVHFKHKGKIP